jgi:hypothetical protein
MRRYKTLAVVVTVAMPLLFCASPMLAQMRKQLVCGRVVDAGRQPVSGAIVSLVDSSSPGRTNSIEGLITGVAADAQGKFCIENFLPAAAYLVNPRLYVTSPINGNAVELVDVPFTRLWARPAKFNGQLIKAGKEERTEVGDVQVQVYYGQVKLKIRDRAGRPLLTTEDEWQPVWLRVRDARGVSVYESGLSADQIERGVDLENSSITLALPEGIWFLEAALKGVPVNVRPASKNISWLRVPKKLRVSAGRPIEVELKDRLN